MKAPAIQDPHVQAVFDGYDARERKTLLTLRTMVFEAAQAVPGVGGLEETLKWGQLSYLPKKPRVGTTVRIDRSSRPNGAAAVFFHCQTRLLDTFRERYPDSFTYVGNRSIELDGDWREQKAELQHCLGLALSYHIWKSGPAPLVD